MADITQVQNAVASQLTQRSQAAQSILSQADSFLQALNNLATQLFIPNYITTTPANFQPAPISMTVPAPTRPNLTLDPLPEIPIFTSNPPAHINPPAAIDKNIPAIDMTNLLNWKEGDLDAATQRLLFTLTAAVGTATPVDLSAAWERMTERDEKRNQASIAKISNKWSALGYDRAPGMMAAEIRSYLMDYDDKKFDQSRDIAYQETLLMYQDRQHTLTSAISLAGIILGHADQVANRALTAARSVTEFGISAYNAMIMRYNAILGATKLESDIAIANTQIDISIEDLRLRSFLGNVQVIREKAAIIFEKLRTLVAVYGVDISQYNATVGLQEATGRITLGQQEMVLKDLETNKMIALQQAIANLNSFIKVAEMKVQGQSAAGHIWAAAITGAYNSVNSLVNLSDSANIQQTA